VSGPVLVPDWDPVSDPVVPCWVPDDAVPSANTMPSSTASAVAQTAVTVVTVDTRL
jgi:hypothetical protein